MSNTFEDVFSQLERKLGFVKDKKEKILSEGTKFLVDDIKNLRGIENASKLIKQESIGGEPIKILAVSDSDTDGIGTFYIFSKVLSKNFDNGQYKVIITNRSQGYGLLPHHIEYAKLHGFNLVITADCGISSIEAGDLAKQYGIELIITDHHTAQVKDCGEIYDPDQNPTEVHDDDDKETRDINDKIVPDTPHLVCSELSPLFKNRYVSGTVVLAMFVSYTFDNVDFDDFLPEMGLTTISDMMPVNTHYNYALIVMFLNIFKDGSMFEKYIPSRQYLITFMDSQKIHALESEDIGFQLSPRINSANRRGEADIAGQFVLEEDATLSLDYYKILTEFNEERKVTQLEVSNRVIYENEAYLNEQRANGNFIIITLGEELIKSSNDKKVFGLVANKLVKDYGLPAMVLGYSESTKSYSGSGRSPWPVIDTLNIFKNEFNHHLGGHAAAFGIGVFADKLDSYRKIIANNKQFTFQKQNPVMEGYVIRFDDLTQPNLKKLHSYITENGPYGIGWLKPNIIFENPNFKSVRRIGKQLQFNKFKIAIKKGSIEAVDFSPHKDFAKIDMVKYPPRFISGNLQINSFGGKSSIDLLIQKMSY